MFPAGERLAEVVFAPARDLSTSALAEALARVLSAREAVEALPTASVKPLVTIEEMMNQLSARVQSAMTLSFKEFAPFDSAQGKWSPEQRVDVIVSFLALLELMKQGIVAAEQRDTHGDIRISHTAASATPRYG